MRNIEGLNLGNDATVKTVLPDGRFYYQVPVVRLENKVKKMLCHHSLVCFLLVIV